MVTSVAGIAPGVALSARVVDGRIDVTATSTSISTSTSTSTEETHD